MENWPAGIPLTDVGEAWVFPERATLVTCTTKSAPTTDDVHALFDLFLWIVDHLPPTDPPLVIHDWRSFRVIPPDIRHAFLSRRTEITLRPKRVVVCVTMSSLVRMAMQTVALGAHLLGRSVELSLVPDLRPTLSALRLPRPDEALHARLRLSWRRAQAERAP